MADADSGLGNEPAAPTLDSILDTAIETHTPKEDAPAPVAEAASPDPETSPKAEHPTDPTRYADGTFKPQKDDSAAKASDKEPAETAKPEVQAAPDPAPVVQPIEPPARWTAEDKAKFAAWPRDVQEAVVERHKAIEADYTRKTQEAADIRKSAEPLLNAVKPYQQYLQQIAPATGQTPDQMIASLLNVEYQLRNGSPAQKVQAFHQIAQSYGIDLAAISRGEMPAGPDPAFQQLHQEIAGLKQQLAQYGQQSQEWEQQRAVQELEAFSNAKDDAGRPRYPHFERVRGIMAQISQREPTLNLEQLYQKAVEPINTAIAEELRVRQEQAEKQRMEALDKAKKAAPVKSSGTTPNGAAKAKDLDSILSAAIDARMS